MSIRKMCVFVVFFFSSRRRHTRCGRDWSSDVCSSDLDPTLPALSLPQPDVRWPHADWLRDRPGSIPATDRRVPANSRSQSKAPILREAGSSQAFVRKLSYTEIIRLRLMSGTCRYLGYFLPSPFHSYHLVLS